MSADGRPKVPSLSIFFPAYNDSGTIGLSRLWVELVIVRRHRPARPVSTREPLRRSPS